QVIVGDASEEDVVTSDAEPAFHTEGFDLHFEPAETPHVTEQVELVAHVSLEDAPLEEASVRYEIWQDGHEDETDWIDTEETTAGEYSAQFEFKESDTY